MFEYKSILCQNAHESLKYGLESESRVHNTGGKHPEHSSVLSWKWCGSSCQEAESGNESHLRARKRGYNISTTERRLGETRSPKSRLMLSLVLFSCRLQ